MTLMKNIKPIKPFFFSMAQRMCGLRLCSVMRFAAGRCPPADDMAWSEGRKGMGDKDNNVQQRACIHICI